MNIFLRKFLLLIKRQLKSKVFCCLLLSIPLLSIGAHQMDKENTTGVQVAFYIEPSSDFCEKIALNLEIYEGLFTFIQVEKVEELYKLVSNNKVECGYIFPNDLLEELDNGKRKNRVTLVYSPKTTMQKISNEVVYAELFQEYALHLLQSFLYKEPAFETISHDQLNTRIASLYRNALIDGSTFSFQYFDTANSKLYFPTSLFSQALKGLLALLLSVGSLLGALTFLTDIEKGIYSALPYKKLFGHRFLTVLAPTLLVGLVIYPALLLNGSLNNWLFSLFLILLYCIISAILSTFFSILIPKKNIFASVIPLFIMTSFLCTPIFIDFSTFFPVLRILRYFFLPYYFLLF